jgi:hypothetical protein
MPHARARSTWNPVPVWLSLYAYQLLAVCTWFTTSSIENDVWRTIQYPFMSHASDFVAV